MRLKFILGGVSVAMILILSGCGNDADFAVDQQEERLVFDGTTNPLCYGSDISGKTLEIAADTNFTVVHNLDGTKDICITSGSVVLK